MPQWGRREYVVDENGDESSPVLNAPDDRRVKFFEHPGFRDARSLSTTMKTSASSMPCEKIFLTSESPARISQASTQASTPAALSFVANSTTKRLLSSLAWLMKARGVSGMTSG